MLEGGIGVGRKGQVVETPPFEAAGDDRVANEPTNPKDVNTLLRLSTGIKVLDDGMEDSMNSCVPKRVRVAGVIRRHHDVSPIRPHADIILSPANVVGGVVESCMGVAEERVVLDNNSVSLGLRIRLLSPELEQNKVLEVVIEVLCMRSDGEIKVIKYLNDVPQERDLLH